jgi:glycosidase
MMNLISSHDSERALSAMANSNKYKFQSKPPENRKYHTGKPNDLAYKKFKLLIFHQFTFVGSPHIWNGDEMGMWGADDPDNRKPLWWGEFDFEHETPLYPEQIPYNDKPNFNHEINNLYKQLCQLRRSYNGLSHGDYKFLREYIANDIFAYERIYKSEKYIVLINASELDKEIKLSSSNFEELMKIGNTKIEMDKINMGEYSAVILKSN